MKKESVTLKENEFIVNHIQQLHNGCTLIESPTGTGKTSFVLEHLTKSEKILMLVPLVVQVRQLKAHYRSRHDIVFLSGTDKDKTHTLQTYQGKHIVATYDLWPSLQKSLNFAGYTLVIDEVHKMYSAGSYRDEALNPILAIIPNKRFFNKKLLLTATYTESLAELGQLLPDTWFTIRQATPIAKTLNIHIYEESWSFHWLQAVISRLQQREGKKIVFVRLNSSNRMEKAIACLEKLNFKALGISRKTIGLASVKTVVETELLPNNYDVVLTTSIFDEAINLNNTNADIDSVHIVDAVAHPEEIVQFMGRLRKANPPFFLHMQQKDGFLAQTTEKQAFHYSNSIQSKYKTLANFAVAAKQLATEFEEQINVMEIFRGIDVVNDTLRNFLECSVLTKADKGMEANTAGILACCYKTDIFYTYKHYDQLTKRLQTLLPSLIVTQNISTNKAEKSLDKLVAQVNDELETAKNKAITQVCQRIKQDCDTEAINLYTYGADKQKAIHDGYYQENPFCPTTQKLENKHYIIAVNLCTHLTNITDIEKAMIADDYYKIVELSVSYRTDMFKNELRKQLQERMAQNELKIMPADAAQMVATAFRITVAKLPLLKNNTAINRKYGISIAAGNKHIKVAKSKAMNLIVQIANVDDTNSHKPNSRYLKLKGIHWKGYHFWNAARTPAYEHKKDDTSKTVTYGSLADEFI